MVNTEFYKIDTKVVNAVLQYLATKPFQEVYELIQGLQSGEVITDQED